MTRWKVDSGELVERKDDYTAHFTCTNMESGDTVQVTVTQERGKPASDLVGALMVLGKLFIRVGAGEEPNDKTVLN